MVKISHHENPLSHSTAREFHSERTLLERNQLNIMVTFRQHAATWRPGTFTQFINYQNGPLHPTTAVGLTGKVADTQLKKSSHQRTTIPDVSCLQELRLIAVLARALNGDSPLKISTALLSPCLQFGPAVVSNIMTHSSLCLQL